MPFTILPGLVEQLGQRRLFRGKVPPFPDRRDCCSHSTSASQCSDVSEGTALTHSEFQPHICVQTTTFSTDFVIHNYDVLPPRWAGGKLTKRDSAFDVGQLVHCCVPFVSRWMYVSVYWRCQGAPHLYCNILHITLTWPMSIQWSF